MWAENEAETATQSLLSSYMYCAIGGGSANGGSGPGAMTNTTTAEVGLLTFMYN